MVALFPEGRIERVLRKYKMGEEPCEIEEWAHITPDRRLAESIAFWQRHIRWVHGMEPEFERVLVVTRQA